jgi:hypothetical protein
MAEELSAHDVLPGRCKASNHDAQLRIGESRDSGFGPADRPGMTESINCRRNSPDRLLA